MIGLRVTPILKSLTGLGKVAFCEWLPLTTADNEKSAREIHESACRVDVLRLFVPRSSL